MNNNNFILFFGAIVFLSCIICVIMSISCRNDCCNKCYPKHSFKDFRIDNKECFSAINGNYTNGFMVPEVQTKTFKYNGKDMKEHFNEQYEKTKSDAVSEAVSKSLQKIYPPGSIYISFNDTNPSTVLGFGTWELIENRFLYCSTDKSGSTGGNLSKTLTDKELPKHHHKFTGDKMSGRFADLVRYDGGDGSANVSTGVFSESIKSGTRTWQGAGGNNARVDFRFNATPSGTIEDTGEGQAFSLMPPYITIYAWKRTDYDK